MALDPRIPLMLGDTGAPFKAVSAGIQQHRQNKVQAQQLSNENERLQMLRDQALRQKQAHENQMDDRRVQEFFRNVVPAAETALGIWESGDVNGFTAFLDGRIAELDAAGIDSSDTREIRGLANDPAANGDLIRYQLADVINRGRAYGVDTSGSAKFSARTEIVGVGDDMAITGINNRGQAVVMRPDGTQVPPNEVAAVLDSALQSELDFNQDKAVDRANATESAQIAGKFFERAETVNEGLAVLSAAQKALDDGAQSGAVISMLPSVKAASIRLDNLRAQLGLSVIQATTFGALSEGEMALALDTALPTGLPPNELKTWIDEKEAAQRKVLSVLEDAATKLSRGMTVGELLESRKADRFAGFTVLEE